MFEMVPDTTTKYRKITSDYVEECKVNIWWKGKVVEISWKYWIYV